MNPSLAQVAYETWATGIHEPYDPIIPWDKIDPATQDVWQGVVQALLQAFLGPEDFPAIDEETTYEPRR